MCTAVTDVFKPENYNIINLGGEGETGGLVYLDCDARLGGWREETVWKVTQTQ